MRKCCGRERRPPTRFDRTYLAGSTLDKDVIQRVVRSNIDKVRGCYNEGLLRDPELTGRVAIQFTIGEDGTMSGAKIATATLEDSAVHECLANEMLKWKFPRPASGGNVVVTHPFIFEPG